MPTLTKPGVARFACSVAIQSGVSTPLTMRASSVSPENCAPPEPRPTRTVSAVSLDRACADAAEAGGAASPLADAAQAGGAADQALERIGGRTLDDHDAVAHQQAAPWIDRGALVAQHHLADALTVR